MIKSSEKKEEDDSLNNKNCCRFKPRQIKKRAQFKDAVAYSFLRENGCGKRTAIIFCSTPMCHIDSTIDKFGPACC